MLVRLQKVSKDDRYAKRAAELFAAFHTLMELAPVQVESMLLGLDLMFELGYDATGVKGSATAPVVAIKDVLKVQRGPVIVELNAGRNAVFPGAKLPVAIKLSVDEGWHVQAHQPKDPNFIATKFKIHAPSDAILSGEKYPEAKKLSSSALGNEVLVLSGESLMGGFVTIPASASATITLEIEVEFQACDDKKCLAPEKARLVVTLPVSKDEKEIQATNEKIFRALKLE